MSAGQSAVFDPLASDESLGEKSAWAAGGGVLGKGAGALLNRIISPTGSLASSARNEAVKRLEAQGVPVGAAQATGDPTMRALTMGLKSVPILGSHVLEDSPAQKKAASSLLSRLLGQGDQPLTPNVLADIDDSLGAGFDALRGQVAKGGYDKEARDQLASVIKTARKEAWEGGKMDPAGKDAHRRARSCRMGRAKKIDEICGDTIGTARSVLTKRASKAARAGDTETAEVLRDLRQIEDDFAQRAWPDAAGQAGTARGMYGNLQAVQKRGVLDAEGNLNPNALATVLAAKNPKNFAQGNLDEFGQAAKDMDLVFKTMGADSGTARNLLTAKLLTNPASIMSLGMGATTYGQAQDPSAAMAGATSLGTMFALTQTKTGRKYLANALMKNNPELAAFIKKSGRAVGTTNMAAFGADD